MTKSFSWAEQLHSQAASLDLQLSEQMHKRLLKYLEVLLRANSIHNFTRVPEEQWVERHLIDSLRWIAAFVDQGERSARSANIRVVDIGSGAGIPGIPLAIALPAWSFCLVENMTRRAQFLEESKRELALSNISVECNQAQVLAHQAEQRVSYDFALARALAQPEEALELLLPFLKIGGVCVIWAGATLQITSELEEKARELGAGAELKLVENGSNAENRYLVCSKVEETPLRFPRKGGSARKRKDTSP